VPDGTTTVGAVPLVPAGDWSWDGMAAMVDEQLSPALEVAAEVVVVVAFEVVGVVEGLPVELPHAVSPRADADSTTSDKLRRRDMEHGPFRRRALPP
jgi:hypothetical protein